MKEKILKYSILFFFLFMLVWSFWPMQTIGSKLVQATGSKDMLDIKPMNNVDSIYNYIEGLGENGRQVLLEMYMVWDFIYPMAYGGFFILALLYYPRRAFPHKKWLTFLALIPLAMVITDYIENFSIINLLNNFPDKQVTTASRLFYITISKWFLGLLSILLTLLFFIAALVRKKKRS